MQRGIDHLVLAVRNLDKAAILFESLGFSLTPRAHHPFGTDNRLVQMQGNFLELLSVEGPADIFEPTETGFSFPAFNRDFLLNREGMSMLVLESKDEDRDQQDFQDGGLRVHDPFTFSRIATPPDGSEVTVGFSLTFASDPKMPETAFFTCRQWKPELFWKPEYQTHGNGARAIAEVLLVAEDTTNAARFLSVLAGAPAQEIKSGEMAVDTPRGRLTALSPAALEARFPGTSRHFSGRPAAFAGFAVAVDDPDAAATTWRNAGLNVQSGATGPWLEPETGIGAIIQAVAVSR